MDAPLPFRFVTGSVHVDFLKPTPLEATLEICGQVKQIKDCKVVVDTTVTARASVLAVQMSDSFWQVLHPIRRPACSRPA